MTVSCSHPQTSTITRLSGPPLVRCLICGATLNTETEGRSSVLGGTSTPDTSDK